MTDPYAAAAGAYDLFAARYREQVRPVLDAVCPEFRGDRGAILDVGAGSGANSAHVLERVPEATVFAIEPSPAMRSLLHGRIASRPEWHHRITVRPEGFFDAPLPERLGGAVALGVMGHFDAGERIAVLAELAARLPPGGVVLVDLQQPSRPVRVEAYEFTPATIGGIVYRGIAEAWPIDLEAMRWRMTYLTLEGERVLTEETAEHVYRHPAPERFAAEAQDAGFEVHPVAGTDFCILQRR